MKKQNKEGVFYALKTAARSHRLLTAGTLLCMEGSVAASLLPPLLLARMIDSLTGRRFLFGAGNTACDLRPENDACPAR